MEASAHASWSPPDYCRDITVDGSGQLDPEIAFVAYDRVCRTSFDEPGFYLVDLGTGATSESLRRVMVSLKREMQQIHGSRTGRDLIYLSATRFDQQTSTKPHRDGGPDESLLMLGYEPSEVRSELLMSDYSKCAFDLGMTPGEFLERHNPMFSSGGQLLLPYTTPIACFTNQHYQIVLINNGVTPYSTDVPAWQGVLHTATISNPSDSLRRVINSTQIASVLPGSPEIVSMEQQEEFMTTTSVRRRGYDKLHLEDES